MQQSAVLTIEGKKSGARIHCTDLIVVARKVIYLAGYGPSQEVRAFAHLLNLGEARIEGSGSEQAEKIGLNGVESAYDVRFLKASEGYMLVFVTPQDHHYLVSETKEQCRAIYGRILDQKEFVHPQWYDYLFQGLVPVEPQIGSLVCYQNRVNVPVAIKDMLKEKEIKFPPPSACIALSQADDRAA